MRLDYRRDAGRFSHGVDVCGTGGLMKLTTVWRAMWQARIKKDEAYKYIYAGEYGRRRRQDSKFSAYIYKRLKEIDDEQQR